MSCSQKIDKQRRNFLEGHDERAKQTRKHYDSLGHTCMTAIALRKA